MVDDGTVSLEQQGHLLIIGLNRPKKYNSYTPKMAEQLIEALTRLDMDPELRVGVVFGHGKNFCAGLDLPLWTKMMSDSVVNTSRNDRVDPVGLGRACRKPIVTAVQGITYTFGIELALAGDIVVAADDCRFSQLEPARGIHATGGATIRFPERAGWGNSMYHLLTCDEFDAAEAYRIGLVQEVVPAGNQFKRSLELAETIAAQAPLAVQATKASARLCFYEGPASCTAALDQVQSHLMASEDAAEGVQSFIERRAAVFKGR